ncbi:tetratricopeptide repeat protein [Thermoanaerobacterium thermosaccharolyticum]|uniref:tetratricopeptide repeat protein n=1 Tax=Thermoanaerobacterium thermosaccharolyticum TaxID=1517 RepID=UPI003DA91DCC
MSDFLNIISFIIELFSKERFRHPRIFNRLIVGVIFIFLLIYFYIFGWITSQDRTVMIILFSLMFLYAFIAYKAVNGPIGLSRMKLNEIESIIEQGLSWNRDDLFSKMPIYFIDFTEIYKYKTLQARYFIERNDFKKAYEIYNSIDERKLFKNEKRKLYQNKAFTLIYLGNISKADELLETIKDEKDPICLMLKSIIFENAGNIDSASKYLQKALNNIPDDDNEINIKFLVYNNFGRIRRIEGNDIDAIYYYRKSAELAKKQKNKQLLHVSYQNLIHSYLLQGKYDKVNEYFKEYQQFIDINTLNDLIELYNFIMEWDRQKLDINNLRKNIIDGYYKLRDKIDGIKRLCFDVNALRIMFNANMDLNNVLEEINKNIECYFSIKMPDKYFCFKEIIQVLKEVINYRYYQKFYPLYQKISFYMRNLALSDIESYIDSLKDYEVYERCKLETEKIILIKNCNEIYDFDRLYKNMIDIKDIYGNNGMFIDMIDMDLNIVDECFNAYKSLSEHNELLNKIREHLKLAEDNVSKIKNHPKANEFNLRLAYYFLGLGDKIKAKYYLDKFEASGITIANYASWLQRYYNILKLNL